MKNILRWLNPNIKMKRWLLVIFIGAIAFGYAISNLIIYKELTIDIFIVTAIIFIIGGSLITLAYIMAQTKILQLITGINVMNETDNKKIQKLFRDKTLYEKNPKISIIGTGNGIINIIESVKKYSNNIDVLIPFFENDVQNTLIHLSTQEDVMKKMFENNYIFNQIEVFKKLYGDYEKGLNNLSNIYSMCGNIIPITFDNIEYFVTLSDGVQLTNNDDFPKINIERGTKITNLKIKNSPKLTKTAIESVSTSDIIIFAPCNLYSELLPMLLVDDLYKLCKKSKSKKIYFNNIMTISGETTFYDIYDHIEAIRNIIGDKIIDYVICDKGNIDYTTMIKAYNQNTSEPVKYNKDKFNKKDKIKIIQKDLATLNEENQIVYDIKKVGNQLASIFVNQVENQPDSYKATNILNIIINKIKNNN